MIALCSEIPKCIEGQSKRVVKVCVSLDISFEFLLCETSRRNTRWVRVRVRVRVMVRVRVRVGLGLGLGLGIGRVRVRVRHAISKHIRCGI